MPEFEGFINGTAVGSTAQRLIANNMDVGIMRPYLEMTPSKKW